jgi:tetratricopeptide (TPR) repeat protein
VLIIVIGVLAFMVLRPTRPEKMTGEFNIAVAEFAVVDENGAPVRSAEGRALADFVHQRLRRSFDELDLQGVNYEIWPPEYAGRIQTSAEALAADINAQVIIYGTITQAGDRSEFTPHYYVNYQGFNESPEITGEHALGAAMRVRLPFSTSGLAEVENPALSARAGALNLISLGLAYYSIDDFEQALGYFQQAAQMEGWLDTAGKEVAYLLIGNAHVRIASRQKTASELEPAAQAYAAALDLNPQYARAQVAAANVLYLQAFRAPENPTADTIDAAKLDQAEAELQTALTLTDAPPSANIRAKVSFYLGQIYIARAQLEAGGGWLAQAQAQFNPVIAEYQNGNASLTEYAGHAYARLGLIARLQSDPAAAIGNYQKAVPLVSPFYQAAYSASLGEAYLASGDRASAIEAYLEAVRIAEFYGDAESANTYAQRLQALQAGE